MKVLILILLLFLLNCSMDINNSNDIENQGFDKSGNTLPEPPDFPK